MGFADSDWLEEHRQTTALSDRDSVCATGRWIHRISPILEVPSPQLEAAAGQIARAAARMENRAGSLFGRGRESRERG